MIVHTTLELPDSIQLIDLIPRPCFRQNRLRCSNLVLELPREMDHGIPNLIQSVITVALSYANLYFPQRRNPLLSVIRDVSDIKIGNRGGQRKYLVFWICLTDRGVPSGFLILIVTDIFLQDKLFDFINAVEKVFSEVLKSLLAEGCNQVTQLSPPVR